MRYDVVVVGGGVVGLATAWHLSCSRPAIRIVVVEKEPDVGRHQTGHNSGVVHSGIYYEPGSLKATLCRRGSRATREFAAEHGIPVRPLGKLIVATDEVEVARLSALRDRAGANGIPVERVDAARLRELEPAVSGLGAVLVPEVAITDYAAITRALAADVVAAGGEVRTGAEVTGVDERHDGVAIRTTAGDVVSDHAVFCAGLQSDRMARLSGVAVDVRIVPFRGEYYDVVAHRADLVSHLVYPVPDPDLPFLGVHLTPTIDGGLTVGPNAVLGLAREGYRRLSVDARDVADLAAFPGMWRVARTNLRTGVREMRNSWWKRGYLRECQRYCPSLTLGDLLPREAGIRAQAVRDDGSFVHDFLLRRTGRTLHVLNAPSPAATSAIPIGEMIAAHLVDGEP